MDKLKLIFKINLHNIIILPSILNKNQLIGYHFYKIFNYNLLNIISYKFIYTLLCK